MTKEEFDSIGWNRKQQVLDDYGHQGNVLSVNFEFGVIHYDDNVKKCSFGRHYKDLYYIGESDYGINKETKIGVKSTDK